MSGNSSQSLQKWHLCRDNGSWFTPLPNQPKLHHFLPDAYLPRFADEHSDLWVLDRKQGIVRRQSPEVTAAEPELYTLEDDCGERDRSVESALADLVDGPGQHAIRCSTREDG